MLINLLKRLLAGALGHCLVSMQRYIVVAEKKSVANTLSSVLRRLRAGAVVTSVSGHLMDCDLVERFKKWRLADLADMLRLENVRLVVSDEYSYRRVREVFTKIRDGILVVATDNDHEGELIGFELVKAYKEVRGEGAEYKRMRFNSLEFDEISRAWNNLEPDLNWSWVYKAQLRRVFDLLTGASFTRLLTLSVRKKAANSGVISWGPVQSPCLKFVVDRERLIREFKPSKYWYISCLLKHGDGDFTARTSELWAENQAKRLYETLSSAEAGEVTSYEEERVSVPRPLPARTDDSLRDLVKITGQPSLKVMGIMEYLYQLGTLSYPRTETNKYPAGFDFMKRLKALAGLEFLTKLEIAGPPKPRNGKLNDGAHPPIYPTALFRGEGSAKRVWEYFARRFVANAFFSDAQIVRQKGLIRIAGVELYSSGRYFARTGFYDVFPYFKPQEELIPKLKVGDTVKVIRASLIEDETRPPPRLSESELLRIMESNGLGTDATRPLYPSLLLERGFVARHQRALKPTQLGDALIQTLGRVDERLVTPETRRTVEEYMARVGRGEISLEAALAKALELYRPLLEKCLSSIDEIGESLGGR